MITPEKAAGRSDGPATRKDAGQSPSGDAPLGSPERPAALPMEAEALAVHAAYEIAYGTEPADAFGIEERKTRLVEMVRLTLLRVRDEALEEAARFEETHHVVHSNVAPHIRVTPTCAAEQDAPQRIMAAAIRALKTRGVR